MTPMIHRVSVFYLAACVLACFIYGAYAQNRGPHDDATSKKLRLPASISTLERDQPRLKRIFRWDGRIVAHAGEFFFEIDLAEGKATPIHFVGDRDMVALTTAFGRPYALGKDHSSYVLFFRPEHERQTSKRGWDMLRVPRQEHERDSYTIAVGSKRYLALLGSKTLKLCDGTAWKTLTYTGDFIPAHDDSFCLLGNKLYVGRDRGEFGGALYELDLSSARWRNLNGKVNSKPVVDLRRGPDGSLWIVSGLSHMGLRYGQIARLTAEGVQIDLTVTHDGCSVGNWKHEPSSFSALDFTSRGEPVLLAEELGLLVRQQGDWKRLTPDWPGFTYLSSLLIVGEEKFLIGTSDAGLVFVSLRERKEKIIRFATSFYEWREQKDPQQGVEGSQSSNSP